MTMTLIQAIRLNRFIHYAGKLEERFAVNGTPVAVFDKSAKDPNPNLFRSKCTPPHRRNSVDRPAEIYLHRFSTDTRCGLENLSGMMDDGDGWRERVGGAISRY